MLFPQGGGGGHLPSLKKICRPRAVNNIPGSPCDVDTRTSILKRVAGAYSPSSENLEEESSDNELRLFWLPVVSPPWWISVSSDAILTGLEDVDVIESGEEPCGESVRHEVRFFWSILFKSVDQNIKIKYMRYWNLNTWIAWPRRTEEWSPGWFGGSDRHEVLYLHVVCNVSSLTSSFDPYCSQNVVISFSTISNGPI